MQARLAIQIICAFLLCSQNVHSSEIEPKVHQSRNGIEQTLEEKRDALMALSNVVATGISMCGSTTCIKVMVLKQTPELRRQLEQILGQYPYVVEQTGSLHTLPAED